jgi:hypothetical protein
MYKGSLLWISLRMFNFHFLLSKILQEKISFLKNWRIFMKRDMNFLLLPTHLYGLTKRVLAVLLMETQHRMRHLDYASCLKTTANGVRRYFVQNVIIKRHAKCAWNAVHRSLTEAWWLWCGDKDSAPNIFSVWNLANIYCSGNLC